MPPVVTSAPRSKSTESRIFECEQMTFAEHWLSLDLDQQIDLYEQMRKISFAFFSKYGDMAIDAASDLFHTTLDSMLQSNTELHGNFRPYFVTSLFNEVSRFLERSSRNQQISLDEEIKVGNEKGATHSQLLPQHCEPPPHQQSEQNDTIVWLHLSIESLPEKQRETLRLSLGGMSNREIQARLGVAQPTVSRNLTEAKKKLIEMLSVPLSLND